MPGLVHPSEDAAAAMSARLSQLPDLRLPATLLRETPGARPGAAAVQDHLRALLRRDAAVFLERYARQLLPEELRSFEPLRNNYEVAFYLEQAEEGLAGSSTAPLAAGGQQPGPQQQQQEQQGAASCRPQPPLSSTAKNRRLAYMRRLEQQGDYFSEAAMRQRQPLVWQEHIGRHEGHPPPPAGPQAGDHRFASSLLANYDEAMFKARLQQEMEEEQAAQSEHESDSDDEDSGDSEDAAGAANGAAGAGAQHHRHQQHEPALPPTAIRAARAGGAGPAQAAAAAAAAAAASRQAVDDPHGSAAAAAALFAGPAPGVDMGTAAMARRRREFLQEMQARFLQGQDEGGEGQQQQHSYAAIDADASLDEDWAKQQAQDAEDAYFDAD